MWHFSGKLGQAVSMALNSLTSNEITAWDTYAERWGGLDIYISDSIDLLAPFSTNNNTNFFCFFNSRGVIVTAPLMKQGKCCISCFSKRYMSTISFFDHEPSVEHALQRITQKHGDPRAFWVPDAIVPIVLNLISHQLRSDTDECSWYIDLTTCDINSSKLVGVHGCPQCNVVANREKRYLSGMQSIFTSIKP